MKLHILDQIAISLNLFLSTFCLLYPNFQDFLIFFVFMKKAQFQETFIVATGNTMLLMLMTLWIKVQMCNRIK